MQQAILGEADAAVKVKVDVRQLLLALESRSGATLLLKEVRGLNCIYKEKQRDMREKREERREREREERERRERERGRRETRETWIEIVSLAKVAEVDLEGLAELDNLLPVVPENEYERSEEEFGLSVCVLGAQLVKLLEEVGRYL